MYPEPLPFMGRARNHLAARARGEGTELNLVFPADQGAVRGALKTAMRFLRAQDITPGQSGSAELVLAEVINNIIEHAYRDGPAGLIELRLRLGEGELLFTVLDDGLPMPGGNAPKGRPHDLDREMQEMPEGGFGWFLIRELTEGLDYRREECRNSLHFRMRLRPPPAPN